MMTKTYFTVSLFKDGALQESFFFDTRPEALEKLENLKSRYSDSGYVVNLEEVA